MLNNKFIFFSIGYSKIFVLLNCVLGVEWICNKLENSIGLVCLQVNLVQVYYPMIQSLVHSFFHTFLTCVKTNWFTLDWENCRQLVNINIIAKSINFKNCYLSCFGNILSSIIKFLFCYIFKFRWDFLI